MNPLPELFSEPFAFDGLVGDVALPAAAFAGASACPTITPTPTFAGWWPR